MANQGRIDVHAHSMSPAYRAAIQAIGGIIRTPDWSPDMARAWQAILADFARFTTAPEHIV